MTVSTKLKLLMPILYSVAAGAYIVLAWPDRPVITTYVGAILVAVAFCLWITARVQLGNAFSIAPRSKFLVTTGLYAKFRHPVYYFSILAVLGLAVYSGSIVGYIALILLVALEAYRIRAEERLLMHKFGKEYTEYKLSTWF